MFLNKLLWFYYYMVMIFADARVKRDLADNLQFWMTNLPAKLRNIPITSLAIPGSHNSMTYNMSSDSSIAPDTSTLIKAMKYLGSFTTNIMSRWGKTQDYDVARQLKNGIRYFDLRIAKGQEADSNKFFFVHGLYAGEVRKIFRKILYFLEFHHDEVVILDCNHFYNFEDVDHKRLLALINDMFSRKLVPYTNDMSILTLNGITSDWKQVIFAYNNELGQKNIPKLFSSDDVESPWHDTNDIETLFSKLDESLPERDEKKAFVSQLILTPSKTYVMLHLYSSLKEKIAIPLQQVQSDWINKQTPGPKGVNIIINDFVDLDYNSFAKDVINLNNKLL